MTRAKTAKASDPAKTLQYALPPGKSEARVMAELGLDPAAIALGTIQTFSKGTFGDLSMTDTFEVMREQIAAAETGDLSKQRAMLAAQTASLNAIFIEMARRSAANMGDYPLAMERYMRLALKAQAQSRATVDALDRLTNGHEQTVRHVHVDNRGGQAIIADTVQTGGPENENQTDNAMQLERLAQAPRCLAWTRSRTVCQSPAVHGKRRCRMHGGTNPGAPKGNRNAWKHGGRSGETMQTMRMIAAMTRMLANEHE